MYSPAAEKQLQRDTHYSRANLFVLGTCVSGRFMLVRTQGLSFRHPAQDSLGDMASVYYKTIVYDYSL